MAYGSFKVIKTSQAIPQVSYRLKWTPLRDLTQSRSGRNFKEYFEGGERSGEVKIYGGEWEGRISKTLVSWSLGHYLEDIDNGDEWKPEMEEY